MPTETSLYYFFDQEGNAGMVVLPVLERWDMIASGLIKSEFNIFRLLPQNSCHGVYFAHDRDLGAFQLLVRPSNSPEDIKAAAEALWEWDADVRVQVINPNQWLDGEVAAKHFSGLTSSSTAYHLLVRPFNSLEDIATVKLALSEWDSASQVKVVHSQLTSIVQRWGRSVRPVEPLPTLANTLTH